MSLILRSESTPKENDLFSAPSGCKSYLFYEVRPDQDLLREKGCYLLNSSRNLKNINGNSISLVDIIIHKYSNHFGVLDLNTSILSDHLR